MHNTVTLMRQLEKVISREQKYITKHGEENEKNPDSVWEQYKIDAAENIKKWEELKNRFRLLTRMQTEWAKAANEEIDIQQIGSAVYGFGSELATLRLLKHYRNTPKADHGYSVNLEKYYFRLEL